MGSTTVLELKERSKSSGTWTFTIKKFSKHNVIDRQLESPCFGLTDDDVWNLRVYLNRKKSYNGEFLEVYLFCKAVKDHVKLKYEFSIISTNFKKAFEYQNCHPGVPGESWGWCKLAKKSELLANKNLYLPNDNLTISCKITRFSDHYATELISVPVSQHLENLQSLLQHGDVGDLITLRVCQLNQQSSATASSAKSVVDLSPEKKKLKTDNNEINGNTVEVRDFKVYQGILTSQSSVFKAMFEHREIKENQENLIEINDMNPQACDDMIHFLHRDELRVSEKNLIYLLAAADKYELMRLKALCEEAIYKKLSKENSLITLSDADSYNAIQLKKATLKFIIANIDEIKESDEYKLFKKKNLALALEIFEKLYEKQKEDD